MVNTAYLDTLEDDQTDARSREAEAFKQAQELIQLAELNPRDDMARTQAIHVNLNLWSFLLENLADQENQNSAEFKAQFISTGIFVLRHLQEMREVPATGFSAIFAINATILEGLER